MAAETTPDLSEFIDAANPKRKRCAVGAAAGQLTEQERGQLAAACAVDSTEINAGAIVKWLAVRGHDANATGVTHHRNGTCSCARS